MGVTILRSQFLHNSANDRAAGARVTLGQQGPLGPPFNPSTPVNTSLVIESTIFQNNDAPQASALLAFVRFDYADVALTNVTSTNNTGKDCKGGVNVVSTTSATLTNSTLEGSGTNLCLPTPGVQRPPVSRRFMSHCSEAHTFRGPHSVIRRRIRVARAEP